MNDSTMNGATIDATSDVPSRLDWPHGSRWPAPVRKVQFIREAVLESDGVLAHGRFMRAAGVVILSNICCEGGSVTLANMAELGEQLAAAMMPSLLEALGAPAVAYGKASIVGDGGRLEHGAALIHPRLGAPVRRAIGGGKSIMPSNNKLGPPGSFVDIPLGHKDESFSFAHIDTFTLSVAGAPRSDEIVLFIALASGQRAFAEIGTTK